jgi:hypothetical protein
MTPEQLHILQHSLGVDQYGRGEMYRNHYVGGENQCRPLVALGYMVERAASELTGGDPCFHVTEAGKRAMLAESPIPPKLTRAQERYRRFLAADTGYSFGEWLKAEKDQRKEQRRSQFWEFGP